MGSASEVWGKKTPNCNSRTTLAELDGLNTSGPATVWLTGGFCIQPAPRVSGKGAQTLKMDWVKAISQHTRLRRAYPFLLA